MTLLYKICPAALWREARANGVFAGASIDLKDGFIHLSTAEQVAETAARHFAGQDDLALLAIDSGQLGQALRYEASRGGALFPHLFSPLPLQAVVAAEPLTRDAGGAFVFPRGDAFDGITG